jgi:hypothetical protein
MASSSDGVYIGGDEPTYRRGTRTRKPKASTEGVAIGGFKNEDVKTKNKKGRARIRSRHPNPGGTFRPPVLGIPVAGVGRGRAGVFRNTTPPLAIPVGVEPPKSEGTTQFQRRRAGGRRVR